MGRVVALGDPFHHGFCNIFSPLGEGAVTDR